MATKFLFVSYEGLIADIAWQVIKEGHEAKFWVQDPAVQEVADGFVPKAKDWRKEIDWADVIVFDDVLGGMGTMAEELRQAGKRVVGGSPYTDRLEEDRAFGQQELKAAGVPIIPQENFTSFDEAMKYIAANPNRYVLKPSGEAQNNKRLLFVGEEEDGRDVIQVLEDYKRHLADTVKEFQLQRRIVGVEVAVGRVLQRQGVRHAGVRQLRAQEAVSRRHRSRHRRDGHLDVLERAQPPVQRHAEEDGARLAQARFSSYIDVNCIVNSNGIYPLEFTSRFGYPAISIQQDGLLTPISEVLQNFLTVH
jgi:phosphoribosylamine--glycine ligase